LEEKTKYLSVATVEIGLEANAEKTVQEFMSCERKQDKDKQLTLKKSGKCHTFRNNSNISKLRS